MRSRISRIFQNLTNIIRMNQLSEMTQGVRNVEEKAKRVHKQEESKPAKAQPAAGQGIHNKD